MPFGSSRPAIAFDSQGRIFFATGHYSGDQVLMSEDNGNTWRRISLPTLYATDTGVSSQIGDVIVDEQDRIYYCMDNRIYRSLDATHILDPDWNRDADRNVLDDQPYIRWEEITPAGDPGDDNVFNGDDPLGGVSDAFRTNGHRNICTQITIHNGSLYMALYDGLYRSDNYDTSYQNEIVWHKISSGATSVNGTITPLDSYGATSFAFGPDGALYAGHGFAGGLKGQGLFKTSNPTADTPDWIHLDHPQGNVIPFFTFDGTLLTGHWYYGGDRIYRFNAGNGQWDKSDHHRWSRIREFVELADGALMAATWGRGVVISHDKGQTWEKFNQGMMDFYDVAGVSPDGSRIYRGGLQTPMYSDDEGESWNPCGLFEINGAQHAYATHALYPTPDGDIYVATTSNDNNYGIRVWQSTDDCITWIETGKGESSAIPANQIWFRTFAMTPSGQLFGGVWDDDVDGGIYAYDPTIDVWTHLSHNGLYDSTTGHMRVSKLIADDHGNLLATVGYEPASLFISSDNGASWRPLNEGIPTGFHSVRAFSMAPNGDLLINTASSGVFKAVWLGDHYSSWQSLGLALHDSQSITADAAGNIYSGNTQYLRMWPEDHGIYMLPAGRTEWTQLDAGELHQGGNVWAHPNPSNGETLLLVGSDGGLMRSCGARYCQILPAFTKTADRDIANPGETIQYTISINPRGSQSITGTVALTDTLPSGMRYIVGSMAGDATYNSQSHAVHYSQSLTDETPITIHYDVIVKPETQPGTILQNIAILETDQGDYAAATTVSVPDQSRTAQTLLLVMAGGDNDLSDDVERLRQNLELSANNPYVTTLLLQDGDGPNDARLYRFQHNHGTAPSYIAGETVWDWPENTASPHSLAGFIKGAIKAYPHHDQVVLSLVGHGNGWSPNVAVRDWDDPSIPGQHINRNTEHWTILVRNWGDQQGGLLRDESSQDSLSTRELGLALGWAYAATGQKLGLIYFDNCSMQMTEVAYEIRDYADYVLGSESVAWAAFPYDKHLADIGDIIPKEIADRWLQNEADVLRKQEGQHYPFTLSIIDLQQLEQIVRYENRLAQALIDALTNNYAETRDLIQKARFKTDSFESFYDGEINQADSYGDLYSFALALDQEFVGNPVVRQAARDLRHAILNSRSGHERHNARPWLYRQVWEWHDLGGLSKYLPFDLEQHYPRLSYYNAEHLAIARDGLWDDLVQAYWRNNVARRSRAASQTCEENCINYGKQFPLRPPVVQAETIVGPEGQVAMHLDTKEWDVREIEFTIDLSTSCLYLDDVVVQDAIDFNLSNDFITQATYEADRLAVTIADEMQPYTKLESGLIATIHFAIANCPYNGSENIEIVTQAVPLTGERLESSAIVTTTLQLPEMPTPTFTPTPTATDAPTPTPTQTATPFTLESEIIWPRLD